LKLLDYTPGRCCTRREYTNWSTNTVQYMKCYTIDRFNNGNRNYMHFYFYSAEGVQ
jgi:hypothetical protein